MLFSVIIPAYNCAETIQGTVESIQKANLFDYEIIIVDDGSVDTTEKVCKKLSAKFKYIRYFRQDNRGVSATRNKGILEAKGDYILFVDADDTIIPFKMDDISSAIKKQASMIMFGMKFVYWRGDKILKKEELSHRTSELFSLESLSYKFETLFRENYLSAVCNKFIKREIIIKNKLFFDSRLTNYEDLEFTLKILAESSLIAVLPEVYYEYNNVFGKDRTKDRIALIDNIMENTDIIARSFLALDKKIVAITDDHIQGIYSIILQIYQEIFRFKMYTTSFKGIKRYCNEFVEDECVQECLNKNPEMREDKYIKKILRCNTLKIYLEHLYIRIRHSIANNIKKVLYTLQRG